MSTLAPPPSTSTPELAAEAPISYGRAPGRRHFWLRRVHSLMGLVFGAYITVHLLVNATGLWPRAYQQNVDHIHALEPMLPLIEIFGIFLPLLVHALYGLYITKAGVKFNTTKYNYGGNVRYTLQRWTAVILLLFIGYHIATLHKWGLALFGVDGYPLFNPKNVAYQSTASAIKTPYDNMALNVAVMAFYLLGIWSAVFHWANGLWTSAIAWGLTTTANAQRRWGHVCVGFGIIMLVIGSTAWYAFAIKGDPELDISATQTLPDQVSQDVHSEATGGIDTDTPLPAGDVPADSSSTAPAAR